MLEVMAERAPFCQLGREISVEGDPPQRNHDPQIPHQRQFLNQPTPAGADFNRARLVLRRRAVHRTSDPGIHQLHAILPRNTLRLRGKTGLEQCAIEKLPGTIPGKYAPGAVRAVRAGRQTDDQQTRVQRPERRNRTAPVGLFGISAPLHCGYFADIFDQPWAAGTLNNTVGPVRICQMKTPFRLDGRRALITGGASGIGEATARAFSGAGAEVIIADVDESRARKLAQELDRASVRCFDITDEAAVKNAFATIDRLDILVNNAGIGLVGDVTETSLPDFERVFRVNVTGLFLVTKYALPHLLISNGSIVNIGSVAGLIGVKRRFGYSATKGAVIAITRQLAVDYPKQIRVNCICPGTVDTPFVEGYLQKYHADELEKTRSELNARQPSGRLGQPEEIANLALYMCSEEAAFMQGSVVPIDGGWTAA